MDALRIAAILDAAVTPDHDDRAALARLTALCWPGGDDRTVPIGRRWVSQWGPRPMKVKSHRCAGGCSTCN